MVRGSAFHPLCALLDHAGISSARLLHEVGISPAFAGTEAPLEQAVPSRLFAKFISKAHRVSGIRDFGLIAGSSTSVLSIGDLGLYLEESFTVKSLLARFAAIMPLINSGSQSWIEPGGEAGSLRFCHRQLLSEGHSQIDGYALPIFINAVRLGAGPTWRPKWISLNRTAGLHENFETLSEAEVLQDSDYFAFEVPEQVLHLPIKHRTGKSHQPVGERIRATAPPTNLHDFIRQTLRSGFGSRVPTHDEIAEIVGTPERSLRRLLKAEYATSYSSILDQVRIDEACALLKQHEIGIDAIASHLGYSNHPNFTHAFRRWTGITPSEYRAASTGTEKHAST